MARRLAMEEIHCIYTSPLKRALQTAEIINQKFSHPLQTSDCLREVNFGAWEGLTFDEIVSGYPELSRQWMERPAEMRPPGGENFQDLQNRAVGIFNQIYQSNKGKNILVVTHGGVISVLLCHILQIEIHNLWKFISSNTGISVVEEKNEELVLTTFNENGHLRYF